MKFSEYIKQLKECESEIFVIVNYKNEKSIYKNENKYDNLNVSGDGFIKIEEYLCFSTPCIEVFLSDNDEKSNCFVLEILKMKHEKELKRKQEAQKDLEEYQEWSRKQDKLDDLWLTICLIIIPSLFCLLLYASKVGWL